MDFPLSADLWLTRSLLQHSMGAIYLIAFLVTAFQFRPLLGSNGLIPVPSFLSSIRFRDAPTLFHLRYSDRLAQVLAWLGVALSVMALTGVNDSFGMPLSLLTWFLLWAIYLSFVNVGDTFYAFGWESLLLETGFLMIFLGSSDVAPPTLVIWLLRWVLFRIMFGAGLIKLRGDRCWYNLSCLQYHYETQPMPGPLSWYFHHLPVWVHKLGVIVNHGVELGIPLLYFAPSPISEIAGAITIGFQLWLIFSGNLSWLNWITIVLAFSCFSDPSLALIIPVDAPAVLLSHSTMYSVIIAGLTTLIAALSIRPILNMISPGQIMNTSFDPLRLVNTYGAFGHITKDRTEIIFEGTADAVLTAKTQWKEYEFRGKPGNVSRRPRQCAPYHLRLDWLLWFAAMSSVRQYPWVVTLLFKLLENNRETLRLIAHNPFPDIPPRFVRARLYHYRFTTPAERKKTGHWWVRTLMGEYTPALSLT